MTIQNFPRFVLVFAVVLALLGGLGSGLARLGWQVDSFSQSWILVHGQLMICGFLGTLICLERAVALSSRVKWAMIVPSINALGALVLLLAPYSPIPRVLLLSGSLGLLGLFSVMWRLHPSRDVLVMTIGTFLWVIGNLLWLLGQPVYIAVHWWTAFLVLTIVGERLELSRVRRLPESIERQLLAIVGIYSLGVFITILDLATGIRVLGAGALSMSLWLLRYDIARYTVKQTGLPRYIAVCLLIGYGWLGVGGTIGLWQGAIIGGTFYEMLLHAILLGFIFSMIFGHAPIILPALTQLQLPYQKFFYVHLILLHSTLLYRLIGAWSGDFVARQWGGLLNVTAVLLFMVTTAVTVFIHRLR